jgi:isocitrate dehydrogenase
MSNLVPITVAHGDGIGPEIMEASLHIIKEAGARIQIETIEIGEKVYMRGNSAGIEPSAWESLRRTKVFFKAPITTPQGGGFKSLKVTTRKMLGLYANVRPCVSYHPFVKTKHPNMNLVIVRVDVYVAWPSLETNKLAASIQKASGDGLELIMIDNRGVKVWPDGMPETLCTDAYRCRFASKNGVSGKQTVALLGRILDQGIEIVKTENLRTFDGQPGYTLAQGQ